MIPPDPTNPDRRPSDHLSENERPSERDHGGSNSAPGDCRTLRLAIVVGSARDDSLNGAAEWVRRRAHALGGDFRLWYSRSDSDPLRSFRDRDISGGTLRAGGERYHEHPTGGERGYGDVLADCQECRCRIEELVIFHHGTPVDEAELGDRLWAIFRRIRVPICRVVWWACNASVELDVREKGWTNTLMMRLGSLARCQPCGCDDPIELVWPTEGRCYLTGGGPNDTPQTNDGQVHRARWGYRHPDGSLHVRPEPGRSHYTRNPGHREPPHPGAPERTSGEVLGLPVGQH